MIDCHKMKISRQVFFGKDDDNCQSIMVSLGLCNETMKEIKWPARKIHNLPYQQMVERSASQDIGLTSDDLDALIPKWFIPQSSYLKPFFDFMVLLPRPDDNKWKLGIVIQNTIFTEHSTNPAQLQQLQIILNGLLSCGSQIELESIIDIVYVSEHGDIGGKITETLDGASIEPTICYTSRHQVTKEKNSFVVKVYHSIYNGRFSCL